MSYIENTNKVTRDALRRVEKLARERISNRQNQKVKWQGYDANGNAIVKGADGTASVSKIQNPGSPRNTEMQRDTAGTVVKQRKLPPSDPELEFPPDTKYTTHYFVLTRNDGACIGIRLRKRSGNFTLLGKVSQADVEQSQTPVYLMDAVVLNFGATTDIQGGFTVYNEEKHKALFSGERIAEYIVQNGTEPRVVYDSSPDIINLLVEDAPISDYPRNLISSSVVLFRPWGHNFVLGTGPSTKQGYDKAYVKRPEMGISFDRHDSNAFAVQANYISLGVAPQFGISRTVSGIKTWDYQKKVIYQSSGFYLSSYKFTFELLRLKAKKYGGGISISSTFPFIHQKHSEYTYEYELKVRGGPSLAKFKHTTVPFYYVPINHTDEYITSSFYADYGPKGPFIVTLSGGKVSESRDGSIDKDAAPYPFLSLRGLVNFSLIEMYSVDQNAATRKIEWREASSRFNPGYSNLVRFASHKEVDADAEITRYWTDQYYPGLLLPCGRNGLILGIDDDSFPFEKDGFSIAAYTRPYLYYENPPTITDDALAPGLRGFSNAFITLNPDILVIRQVEYKKPEGYTVSESGYDYEVGAAPPVINDIDDYTYQGDSYTYGENIEKYMTIDPNTAGASFQEALDKQGPYINGSFEDEIGPGRGSHDYTIHVVDDRTGQVSSYSHSYAATDHTDRSYQWYPPKHPVYLYGKTFWLTDRNPEVYFTTGFGKTYSETFEIPILYEGLTDPKPVSYFTQTGNGSTYFEIASVREVTRTVRNKEGIPLGDELVEWVTYYADPTDPDSNHTWVTVRMGTIEDFKSKTFNVDETMTPVKTGLSDMMSSPANQYVVVRSHKIPGTIAPPPPTENLLGKKGGEYWYSADALLPQGYAKSGNQSEGEVIIHFDGAQFYLVGVDNRGLDEQSMIDLYNEQSRDAELKAKIVLLPEGNSIDLNSSLAMLEHKVYSGNLLGYFNYPFKLDAVPWTRSLEYAFRFPEQTAGGFRYNISKPR